MAVHIRRHLTGKNDRQPEIKRQQMVMYKLHVRGFSMEDTSCPRKERGHSERLQIKSHI